MKVRGSELERSRSRPEVREDSTTSSRRERNGSSPDLVVVGNVRGKKLRFNPLRNNVASALCKKLRIKPEKCEVPSSTRWGSLGAPCKNKETEADGNCFFRALSQTVCGSQKHHLRFRLAVVKHLENNAAAYEGILRSNYSSMADYLEASQMPYLGSWATEVEIQAAADCFGINVFTFCDGQWLEYSCSKKARSRQGVYLENCDGNHYENVVCVQRPRKQGCYGYCRVAHVVLEGTMFKSTRE